MRTSKLPGRSRRAAGLAVAGLALLIVASPQRAWAAPSVDLLCGVTPTPTQPQVPALPSSVQLRVTATPPSGTSTTQNHPIAPMAAPETVGAARGGPNFDLAPPQTAANTPPGGIRTVNLDGDSSINDASFGWGLRSATGPTVITTNGSAIPLGENPILRLFRDNFQQAAQVGNPPQVTGAGADLHVRRDPQSLTDNHSLDYRGFVDLRNAATNQTTRVEFLFGLDARPEVAGVGALLPDQANLSFLLRRGTGVVDNQMLFGLGLETRYTGLGPTAHPPLAVRMLARIVDSVGTPVPQGELFNTTLKFAKAPADLAVGLRQDCAGTSTPSLSHISIVSPTATSTGSDANVAIEFHGLAGSGLPHTPGGPPGDVVTLEGSTTFLPAHLDVIQRPAETTVTRASTGTTAPPIVTIEELILAPDDPALANNTEAPLFVRARLERLPRHIAVETADSAGDGSFDAGAFDLSCTNSGPPATPSIPIFPQGCSRGAPASVAKLQVQAQNFVPGDRNAVNKVTEVIAAPPALGGCPTTGTAEQLRVGLRMDERPQIGGLFQFAGCLSGVAAGGFDLSRFDESQSEMRASLSRANASDLGITIGAVLVDGTDALRMEADTTLVAAPQVVNARLHTASTRVPFSTGTVRERKTTNVDLAIETPSPLTVRLHRVHVLSGPVGQPLTTTAFATGEVRSFPKHLRVALVQVVTTLTPSKRIEGATVESCPELPVGDPFLAGGGRAPECGGVAAATGQLTLAVQNFAPTDTAATSLLGELPGAAPPGLGQCPPTSGPAQLLTVRLRQDVRPDSAGLFQAGACVTGVSRVSFDEPVVAAGTSPLTVNVRRTGSSSVGVRAALVLVDGTKRVRADANADLRDVSDTLTVRFKQDVKPPTTVTEGGIRATRKTSNVDLTVQPPLPFMSFNAHVSEGSLGGPLAALPTVVFAGGNVTGIPSHLRVQVVKQTSSADGIERLRSAIAEACPTMAVGDRFHPSGGQAPECAGGNTSAGAMFLVAQNFLPTDTAAVNGLPNLLSPLPPMGFVTFASRDARGGLPSHFRAILTVGAVRRVLFDAAGSGPQLPPGASSGPPFARVTNLKVVMDAPTAMPPTLIRTSIDTRSTTTDEAANTGALVEARAVASRIPEHLEVSFRSDQLPVTPTNPSPTATVADIGWKASSPIALTFPSTVRQPNSPANLEVQGPGPTALRMRAILEIGQSDGVGGLAPEGRVRITHTKGSDEITRIAYSASAPTVVRAGGRITTRDDRAGGLRTRFGGVVNLPATTASPLQVLIVQRGGQLTEVGGSLCASAAAATTCPTNRIVAAVHRGRPQGDEPLDSEPPLPAVPAMGGGVTPTFTPFVPGPDKFGEGIRVVSLNDGTIGVRVALRDIASVHTLLDPIVRVQYRSNRRGISPDPVTLNAFVAQAGPLFADAVLSNLPRDVLVRMLKTGGEPTDPSPWLWINTDSISTTTPPNLSVSGPFQPPTGIQLDGVLMLGDQSALATMPALGRHSIPGVDLRVGATSTAGTAVKARILVDVPKHIEIWKPTVRQCGGRFAADTLTTCAARERYEIESRTRVELKAITTAESIGPLGGFFETNFGEQQRYGGHYLVDRVPGALIAYAELVQNRRLPWTALRLHYEAGVPLGQVLTAVFDRCVPAYVGNTVHTPELARPVPPGECMPGPLTTFNQVPNYDVLLQNVPAKLDIDAKFLGSEAPNDSPPRVQQHPACDGYIGRGPSRLGYVHGELDLGGSVKNVNLLVRTGRKASFETSDNPITTVMLDADRPLNGAVRGKLVNVFQAAKESDKVDFEVCLDFDLPFEVTLTGVKGARLAHNGPKLGIDRLDNTGRVQGRVRERFTCRSDITTPEFGCTTANRGRSILRNGAPYAKRHASIEGALVDDYAEDGRGLKGIGVIDVTDRKPSDNCGDTKCYIAAPADTFDTDVADVDGARMGLAGMCRSYQQRDLQPGDTCTRNYSRTEYLLDPVWSTAKRKSGDFELFSETAKFYNALDDSARLPDDPDATDQFRAAGDEHFLEPTLGAGVTRASASGTLTGSLPSVSSQAIGADNTRYRLLSPGGCGRPVLLASHPNNGIVRWGREIPFTCTGAPSHDFSITPNADGSVAVVLDSNENVSDAFALFDASGFGRVQRTAATIAQVRGNTLSGARLTAPARPSGTTRVWYSGAGESSNAQGTAESFGYQRVGTYLAMAVDYNTTGRPVAFAPIRVTIERPQLNRPPDVGVNDPRRGHGFVGQRLTFTTTCGDPDGWHDLSSIQLRFTRRDGTPNVWLRFDQNTGLIGMRGDDGRWLEGMPGADRTLRNRFAILDLRRTAVRGEGPTARNVHITWALKFRGAAEGRYRQQLNITDDHRASTGFDHVGTWQVRPREA